MTYRDLLNMLQMMTETQPSLLNNSVMCSVSEDEYYNIENISMADTHNQFVDNNQPYIVLSS